jgi:hypothetical protein
LTCPEEGKGKRGYFLGPAQLPSISVRTTLSSDFLVRLHCTLHLSELVRRKTKGKKRRKNNEIPDGKRAEMSRAD